MGKRISSMLAIIVGVATMLPASDAKAGQVAAIENLRGPLVNASFSAADPTDPSGCLHEDAFVTANSGTAQDLPTTTAVGIAAVNIDAYNSCTDESLIQAVGQIDISATPAAFVVSRQFDSATLDATIPVADITTGAISQVTVHVVWRATSDLYRAHENTNELYGRGCHVLNRWKGTGRTAVASGTVIDGTTNFTPAASQNAEIGKVVDGFEVIGCS